MKRRNLLLLVTTLTLSLFLRGGLSSRFPVFTQAPTTLLISAAVSLQAAMEAIQPLFEEVNPGIAITYNFGSSGSLQQQIEQGAPVDVFFSAGVPQMNALDEKDLLLPGSRSNQLSNCLVLVVPSDSTLDIADFAGLTDDSVELISVGDFRTVPAGQYAEQVFTSLGILPEVQPKLVFANTVRVSLTTVESGNADAGVFFATDAALSDKVTLVTTASENLHNPILYPLAIIKDTENPEAAQAFVDFLSSDPARKVFEDLGFTVLEQE